MFDFFLDALNSLLEDEICRAKNLFFFFPKFMINDEIEINHGFYIITNFVYCYCSIIFSD
jgi:hypothetical protein